MSSSMESSSSSSSESSKKIRVRHGAQSKVITVTSGMSVSQIRDTMAEALNIPKDATAFCGTQELTDDFSDLSDGQTVEFIKKQGEKG